MQFAKKYESWTVEDWKHVIWSDETKINHLGSDGRKWVWKKAGESLSERLVNGTTKVWGRIFDDVGLHVVGWSWVCMQD